MNKILLILTIILAIVGISTLVFIFIASLQSIIAQKGQQNLENSLKVDEFRCEDGHLIMTVDNNSPYYVDVLYVELIRSSSKDLPDDLDNFQPKPIPPHQKATAISARDYYKNDNYFVKINFHAVHLKWVHPESNRTLHLSYELILIF